MSNPKAKDNWHTLTSDDVLLIQKSDPSSGLNDDEVKKRLDEFGPNTFTSKKKIGPIKRFFLQFHNPLIYILLASSVITAFLGEWVDSSVILAVTLVNAVIGFIQESKAEEALDSLKNIIITETSVIRNGTIKKVPSADVVPGDIVFLQSGDKVPADLRIIELKDLQIDESMLTGESVPVQKNITSLNLHTSIADQRNMAFGGTLVTYGSGRGIVVGTGKNTETGKIANLISKTVDLDTPLTEKIKKFSNTLLYIILGLSVITFLVGILRNKPVVEMFVAVVALAVGAIPEGLPAAITITLAIGVSRMAKKRAIVRNLPAVETLGSTTVICTDKTGTLTTNQMTVKRIIVGFNEYDFENAKLNFNSNKALKKCLIASFLCNDSSVEYINDKFKINGDPTEGALLIFATEIGLNEIDLKQSNPRLDVIPFESDRQYMATLHDAGIEKEKIVYLKGSVEKILSGCSSMMLENGETIDIDSNKILKIAEKNAREGFRVLAFARINVPSDKNKINHDDISNNLTFLGLECMIDPPRPEVVDAIRACHTAGIDVKMITGDHKLTAISIANQVGIKVKSNSYPYVITGEELDRLSFDDLISVVKDAHVFSRVAPEQKLKLVEALQKNHQIVAMTGDGVNDAPALRQANIGIAMGDKGTEVAKDASDMVLTDDNFTSIEHAVEEGRGVFDNMIKFIAWTMPTQIGEGLVIMAAIFAGIALPILPVQILWINMTTAAFLGLMLAFEPKESGIMNRSPRDPKKPIFTRPLLLDILLVSAILLIGSFGMFKWELYRGTSLAVARTISVNVFVIVETFYLFNCRSFTKSLFEIGFFSNKWVIGGTILTILLQLIYTYVPFMNKFFHSAPIEMYDWIRIIIVGIIAYSIVGFVKFIRKRIKTIY